MNVDQIIVDVLDKLNRNNGGCEIPDDDKKKVVNSIKRVFDRFSIDARKLPVIQQFEWKVNKCDNRYTIGPDGDFKLHARPQAIYYAAWKHNPECGCTPNRCCDSHESMIYGWVGDEQIKIYDAVEHFHRITPMREHNAFRPNEMWWQKSDPNAEVVFNASPAIGDIFTIRAAVPFDVTLDCKEPADSDEWEFLISPYHRLCCDTSHYIVCQAQKEFNCDECWEYKTQAYTCEDCPTLIDVTVTAKKKAKITTDPVTFNSELPSGYYSALVDLVAYDVAPYVGSKRDTSLLLDKNESLMLIHRNNERRVDYSPEIDTTVPWNNRGYW